MPSIVCHAGISDDYYFSYCPSLGAAIAFAILFGLTTIAHMAQAIHYRKPFAAILIMGAAWETAGYIVRTLAVYHQLNGTLYTIQTLLILLAPLWINAYIYMLLGRMIHFFLRTDSVFRVPARSITRMFVLFDITAFLVQAIGGVMASPDASALVQRVGMDIYMAGVGVQLGFLVIFTSLAVRFQLNLKKQNEPRQSQPQQQQHRHLSVDSAQHLHPHPHPYPQAYLQSYAGIPDDEENAVAWPKTNTDLSQDESYPCPTLAKRLLVTLYVVMALVIVRNTYRLAEFATGETSPTVTHEWFGYVFDALPMFVASVVLNVWNPGKVLQGARSDFGEQDKERKRAKKEKKARKKEAKQMRRKNRKQEKDDAADGNGGEFGGYTPLQQS
ncbi:hypothetical protein RBB50_010540 [Rhinocladiella similis]